MANNLEYIYRLKDQYSKKLTNIIKRQVAFTETYKKSMGKVNAATLKHIETVKQSARAYNKNNQSMTLVSRSLAEISQRQRDYSSTVRSGTQSVNEQLAKQNKLLTQGNQALRRRQKLTKKTKSDGIAGSKMGLAGLAGGVGAGMFVKSTLDLAVDFEKNLNRIESVSKDIDMDKMRKKALQWGIDTKFSALQVSGAMAEAAQAGMRENEILRVMPGNIALAAAGRMSLVEAMKLSTDVVNQFEKTITNMKAADYLAVGAATAESTVVELGAAMRNTGQAAFKAGLNMEETLSAVMALGKVGYRGELGGTYLMNLFTQMGKMTPKRAKGFTQFLSGTGSKLKDFFNIKTGKFTDFNKFLKLVATSPDEKLSSLTKVFDVRVVKALKALSSLPISELEKYGKALGDVDGKAIKMQMTIMKGLPGGMALFNSAIETTKLIMISSFVAPLSKVLRAIAKFLVYLSKNHKWILKVAFALITLTAAITALGVGLWVISGSLAAYQTMWLLLTTTTIRAALATKAMAAGQWLLNIALAANPVGAIIMGIAALVALFIYATYKLGSFTNGLKFMGDIIIKSLLFPLNMTLMATKKLMDVAASLTGGSSGYFGGFGKHFGQVSKGIDEFTIKYNKLLSLTDNPSLTQLGLIEDLSKLEKNDNASPWIDTKTKMAEQFKAIGNQQKVEVTGNIGVTADKGADVSFFDFNFNTGENMGMAQ